MQDSTADLSPLSPAFSGFETSTNASVLGRDRFFFILAVIGYCGSGSDFHRFSVTDVNEAPTVRLENVTESLAENSDTSVPVKIANLVIMDDALGENQVTLTGSDADKFEIDGSELFLKANIELDFEIQEKLNVTVEVDDTAVGLSPDDSAVLMLNIENKNEAPTVRLENVTESLPENSDTSTPMKIANLVIMDDALGNNLLSLSGLDAEQFELEANVLYLKANVSLDFETQTRLKVAVEVEDETVGASPDDLAELSLDITDVNEAPSISLLNPLTSLPENTDTTNR